MTKIFRSFSHFYFLFSKLQVTVHVHHQCRFIFLYIVLFVNIALFFSCQYTKKCSMFSDMRKVIAQPHTFINESGVVSVILSYRQRDFLVILRLISLLTFHLSFLIFLIWSILDVLIK